jgi:5'-nucleotidase
LKEKPDYVLSGINNGYNVGHDISYSGTLGAAFEAARSGIPAAAFSVTSNAHLDGVKPYLGDILCELLQTPPEPGKVWNVNFPALGKRPLAGILRNRPAAQVSLYREKYLQEQLPDGTLRLTCQGIPTPNEEISGGTDAEAVRQGYISIGQVGFLCR